MFFNMEIQFVNEGKKKKKKKTQRRLSSPKN